ncbi:unnamed protein product [Phytophthora lilii]|uniref:Unnamed protein product n=1 Tax=Phytophthora lilii TaxID=2077276 RepID=A0A9W6X815_9STRA|nr:unnamed protein product [Phytophthora lilii]
MVHRCNFNLSSRNFNLLIASHPVTSSLFVGRTTLSEGLFVRRTLAMLTAWSHIDTDDTTYMRWKEKENKYSLLDAIVRFVPSPRLLGVPQQANTTHAHLVPELRVRAVRSAGVVVSDEALVRDSARAATKDRGHEWDPEVVVVQREHARAEADGPHQEARAQVAGGVDGQSRVHAETHGDGAHEHADGCRHRVATDGAVVLVKHREEAHDQHGGRKELGQEAREVADVLVRVGGKDRLRRGAVGVDDVEHRAVQDVDHEGRHVGGDELHEDVERHLLPREHLQQRDGNCDGRVEVSAGHAAADRDAEEVGETPGQRHGHEAAGGARAQRDLRRAGEAEGHHDEGGEELGHELSGEGALDLVRHVGSAVERADVRGEPVVRLQVDVLVAVLVGVGVRGHAAVGGVCGGCGGEEGRTRLPACC